MISGAATVDAYLAEVAEARRPAMARLRELCRERRRGSEECIEYGMPCYKRGGAAEIAFASQKQYVALYVMKKDVLDEFRERLGASSIGKGCGRYREPAKIDFRVIDELLRRNGESTAAPC